MNPKPVFDEVRRIKGGALTQDEVNALNAALVAMSAPVANVTKKITVRTAMELICHEAIVLEAYKDSKGIWTWSVGITKAAGVNVLAYKDNPQPLSACLAAYIAVLTTKYLPSVERAFKGFPLTEDQLAAALSFHYNTGAIERADWVKLFKAGNIDAARVRIMDWKNPPEIVERRTKERELFFGGHWCSDGKANVLKVSKPSYQPTWKGVQRVDVKTEIEGLLA